MTRGELPEELTFGGEWSHGGGGGDKSRTDGRTMFTGVVQILLLLGRLSASISFSSISLGNIALAQRDLANDDSVVSSEVPFVDECRLFNEYLCFPDLTRSRKSINEVDTSTADKSTEGEA